MRVLVAGHSGQLATALAEQAASRSDIELKLFGRPEIDLAQPETLAARILAERPDVVVNAAAYTAVDRAETEPDLAFVVNRSARLQANVDLFKALGGGWVATP